VNIESSLLRQASYCTTVSYHLKTLLASRGISNVAIVENGFDRQQFDSFPVAQSNKFRIVYAGFVHPEMYESLRLFLVALKSIFEFVPGSKRDFDFRLYCNPDVKNSPSISPELMAHCNLFPYVDKNELIPVLKGACVLLHFSWGNSKGLVTSKLYEYIGSRRPILSIPGDADIVQSTLDATGCGLCADSPSEICAFLIKKYNKWLSNHSSGSNPISHDVHRFTREYQASRLASVLDQVILSSTTYRN
jgi:hypothetical protein